MTAECTIDMHPSVIIAKTASVNGNVKFAAGCVVHPKATIRATNGPIEFGENNLIEELSTIENLSAEPLVIGMNNVFEVGAVVRAGSIGNNNVFGVQSVVEPGVAVSDGCVIGGRCRVSMKGKLPERLVVYGERNEERIAHDDPPNPASQLEILRRMLPNYHYIVKRE